MKNMANDRLDYIDYAKGIGILIIIWGHLYESPAKEFTGSFKVPLFFALSGVLIGLKMTTETILDMRTIVKKKWKSLMIPYLWFSFFDCIYEITKYHQLKNIIRVVYATITGRGLFTLWFLPALFFALIGFYFLYSKISNKNSEVMISSATGCIAIACLITLLLSRLQEVLSGSAYNIVSYPVLTIFHALIGFIFVVVGFYLGRFIKYSDFRDRFCLGLIFMIFGMIINLCCKDVDLNQGMLGKQYFIFYIAAILLCVGGIAHITCTAFKASSSSRMVWQKLNGFNGNASAIWDGCG